MREHDQAVGIEEHRIGRIAGAVWMIALHLLERSVGGTAAAEAHELLPCGVVAVLQLREIDEHIVIRGAAAKV